MTRFRPPLKTAVLTGALVLVSQFANAELLNIQLGFPKTTYDLGTLNYDADATGRNLSVVATPRFFERSANELIPAFILSDSVEGQTLTIDIEVDMDGNLVGGTTDDDFLMTGRIVDVLTATELASGVLLTGKVTGFGFKHTGSGTDSYDFRVDVTDGELKAPPFGLEVIGVTLTSSDSTADVVDPFSESFTGGADGAVGPEPEPGPPGIRIEKFTNGRDADHTNGVDDGAPTFTVGSTTVPTANTGDLVTWTYAITNTGGVEYDVGSVFVEDLVLDISADPPVQPMRVPLAEGLRGLDRNPPLLDQLGGTSYDNGDTVLAPGEVWEYEAIAPLVDFGGFSPGDPDDPADESVTVLGCNRGIPGDEVVGYNNVGMVLAFNAPAGEVQDSDQSNICPKREQACEISVTKTCEILTPPSTMLGKCDGKLKEFTLIWNGSNGVSLTPGEGLASVSPSTGINKGDEVIFTPDRSRNDVFVAISGGATGESKFHISCSDKDMNADNENDRQEQVSPVGQDCGKYQGDGKLKKGKKSKKSKKSKKGKKGKKHVIASGFVNDWLLEGLIDDDDLVLDCTVADVDPSFPTEAEQCEFTPQPEKTCRDIKDITALTMVWDGPDGVDITTELGQRINGVNNGDVIVLDTPKDQTGNDVDVTISGAVSGASKFHISCSDRGMNGVEDCGSAQGNGKKDEAGLVNLFALGGMTGEKGSFSCPDIPGASGSSADVVYGFSIENLSDATVMVTITDDQLGLELEETIGAETTLDVTTGPFIITPDDTDVFKNTVVVTGKTLPGGAMCETTMDMVEVKRLPPPPTPLSCRDIKDITALMLVWDGPNGVDITTELGPVINGVNNGDVIVLDTPKDLTGNDVDVTISGAVSGRSKFHVSCSDKDMNGSEDCGVNQGNGKHNGSDLINDWLFDGMTGEFGSIECLPLGGVLPTP